MNSFLLQNKQIWFFHTFFISLKPSERKVSSVKISKALYIKVKKEGVGVGVGFERIYD